jgi:flagellar assembly protein FliH
MAVLKSHHQSISNSNSYTFDDYEQKKADYLKDIETEGQAILQKAKAKARAVIADAYKAGIEKANDEIEKQKETAIQEGKTQGITIGKEEVQQQNQAYVNENITPMVERLQKLTQAYESTIAKVTDQANAEILQTAMTLANAILLVEPEYNPQILEERIKKSLSYLKVDMEIQVKVHPEDKSHSEKYFADVLDKMGSEAKINWKEDPSLNKGDVAVVSGESQVQLFSLEQWKNALRELKLEDPS